MILPRPQEDADGRLLSGHITSSQRLSEQLEAAFAVSSVHNLKSETCPTLRLPHTGGRPTLWSDFSAQTPDLFMPFFEV